MFVYIYNISSFNNLVFVLVLPTTLHNWLIYILKIFYWLVIEVLFLY